jgi:pSer/pThr/pTyr-binding forkhead associated (FHA) protein
MMSQHVNVGPPQASGGGITCPACGTANAPGVRFCGACGKRLDGGGADAPGHNAGAARTMFMHAAPTETAQRQPMCKLVTIDQTGREGMTFTLRSGETVCGRVNGIVLFEDPFVSPTHCKFNFVGGKLHVADQASLNGIYLRVRADRRLVDGEYLRIGRQLFRFESLGSAAIQIKKPDSDDSRIWGSPHPGAFGRIIQILDDGRTGEIRMLAGDRCQIGREIGDIVIPSDGFISGRHCVFIRSGNDVVLQDLGSSNGTYVRVKGEADVAHGDFLLVGNQMLRVEIQ